MDDARVSSIVTFLYFHDLAGARAFFENTLNLELAYDTGWAGIWKVGPAAYIGAVDICSASVDTRAKGRVLISLTVEDVSVWHKRLKNAQVEDITKIRCSAGSGVRSFFFKGPEGYDFEVQEFMDPEVKKRFCHSKLLS